MAAFIINQCGDLITPVTNLRLNRNNGSITLVDDEQVNIYRETEPGLAEVVFEDLARQISEGSNLLLVPEGTDKRRVTLTLDQISYLLCLVENSEYTENTEGDLHMNLMKEQLETLFGRYFV